MSSQVEARLRQFSKVRFQGSIIRDADGAPFASTDGCALVALGVGSVAVAVERILAGSVEGSLPSPRQIAQAIRSAEPRPDAQSYALGVSTEPDPRVAESADRSRLDRALAEVARLEAALAAGPAPATRRRITSDLASARGDVACRRAALAVAERAVFVGEAALDMRLVRAALRALGARSAAATPSGGALDPVVLVTPRGLAVVMPIRR